MHIVVDSTQNTPLYMQVYEAVKEKIVTRALTVGERLPSIRFLAMELNISRHTVDLAYQHLLAEGYIESRPRSGLFVLPLEKLQTTNEKIKISPPSITTMPRFDFYYGAVDLEKFPLKTWQKCLQRAMDEDLSILLYGDVQGDEGLREEICQYVAKSRDIHCTADQVFICNGTQAATTFVAQLLALSSERVAFEDPGYNEVRQTLQYLGSEIYRIPIEADGLAVEDVINSHAKAVYVTPSHQFPLGMVLSIQKRIALLNWANEHDAYIIEDDYNSEFRYRGKPIPALKSLDRSGRVIYFGTFSKCFLPAARCSYIIFPQSLVEKALTLSLQQTQNCSPLLQRAMKIFMREGFFEKHIRRMKVAYRKKHEQLLRSIQMHLSDHVTVVGQSGGLYVLLKPRVLSVQECITHAEKVGVRIYDIQKHSCESIMLPYVMIGFGGMSEDDIVQGIKLLGMSFSKQEG